MYLEQCRKLYDKLESVLIAHKLIGRTHAGDIYCTFHEHACDNKPGYNIFVSDFKWELSMNSGDWLRVILTSHFINSKDAEKIETKLKEHNIKNYFIEKKEYAAFTIYPQGVEDKDIEIMAEITDLYLSLKRDNF